MLNCLLLCFPSRARNIKDKEQNRQMNKNIVNLEPELSGNCSWTKFAGEELKILAPLQKAAIKSMIMIQDCAAYLRFSILWFSIFIWFRIMQDIYAHHTIARISFLTPWSSLIIPLKSILPLSSLELTEILNFNSDFMMTGSWLRGWQLQ